MDSLLSRLVDGNRYTVAGLARDLGFAPRTIRRRLRHLYRLRAVTRIRSPYDGRVNVYLTNQKDLFA